MPAYKHPQTCPHTYLSRHAGIHSSTDMPAYIFIQTCRHTHIHRHAGIHIYPDMPAYTHPQTCPHTYLSRHAGMHTSTDMPAYIFIQTCRYAYINRHTGIHTSTMPAYTKVDYNPCACLCQCPCKRLDTRHTPVPSPKRHVSISMGRSTHARTAARPHASYPPCARARVCVRTCVRVRGPCVRACVRRASVRACVRALVDRSVTYNRRVFEMSRSMPTANAEDPGRSECT